ncbi:hypothetical protein BDZ97DRAFT_1906324 [Flammula alnicola]|nr:hypothetical protein BDZ97DRAFT_1906324 [Flammula alnicola]
MASTTYDLFFTGRDDPRSCVIIGEDTKPVYFCFETTERNLMPNVRTMSGEPSGGATIGNRQIPMSQLVLAGSSNSARAFISADGKRFEWRRNRENPTSYDLYASQNMRIACFRRFTHATVIGPSHALLQYTFTQDWLLIEALVALCVNRWIDVHGV